MKLSAPPPPPPDEPEPNADLVPAPAGVSDAEAAPEAASSSDIAAAPEASLTSPAAPIEWPGWFAVADAAMAVLAVVLAFLLASSVARNSTIWLHLASGRLLAQGNYSFGVDPFSYSGAGRVWVNHSWLYDLLTYWLYAGAGGSAAVIAKAAGVAVAAVALLAIRRRGHALWPWAVCLTVALLAAAPRMVLEPHVVSVAFLAVLMLIVYRVPGPAGSWRLPAAVGALFAVWANVDAWFFVGPLALAALLLGDVVQKAAFGAREGDDAAGPLGRPPATATLAIALGVGALGCLLNPHHVRVWQLPIEVTGAAALSADPLFRQTVLLSPLDGAYTEFERFGRNVNGAAYALLLVGGSAAICLGSGRLRAGTLFLWFAFALLSLRTVAAIPLFAVVAVPLVAGQWNDLSARLALRPRSDAASRRRVLASGAGRLLALLGLGALAALAWPGWLHPRTDFRSDAPRVAWGVEVDPSQRRVAEQLQAWRAAGRLPADDRGFHAALSLANYCAWFAPDEKVYANGRLAFHAPELQTYHDLRLALGTRPDPNGLANATEATELFGRFGVGHVAVYDRGRRWTLTALPRLLGDEGHWDLWYLDGRAGVFGWRAESSGGGPAFSTLRLDPAVLAFDPAQSPLPAGRVAPAPPTFRDADEFFRPAPTAPTAADESIAWMDFKQVLRALGQRRAAALQTAHLAAGGGGIIPVATHGAGLATADPVGSISLALQALRAARRAVAENPDHPDGYRALAYAVDDPDLPASPFERTLATVTAMRQCLDRLPEPEDYAPGAFAGSASKLAYELARRYYELGRINLVQAERPFAELVGAEQVPLLEFARRELGRAIAYAKAEAAFPGGAADGDLPQLLERWTGEKKQIDDELARRAGPYEDAKAQAPALKDRYPTARRYGLTDEALRLLADADLKKEFGEAWPVVARQRIALELLVGRLEDATRHADAVEGELKLAARAPMLPLLMFQLEGDYAAAGKVLDGQIAQLGRIEAMSPSPALPFGPFTYFTPLLAGLPGTGPLFQQYAALNALAAVQRRAQLVQQQAQLHFSRGLLSLYDGRPADARASFRQSERTLPAGWLPPTTRTPLAQLFIELIDRAAKE